MMKKITFVFTLFVLAISVNAQFPIGQTIGSPVTLLTNKGGFKSTVAFMVTSYTDTSTANLDLYVDTYSGSMIWTTSDGKLWIRNTTATAWILVSGSSGSVNIYNSDGSLSANRNLTGAGFNLGLQGLAKFGVGADSATFTMNGGAQFLIKPTLSYFLGNVGIGTATPGSKLTVTTDNLRTSQSSTAGIVLENSTYATNSVTVQNPPPIIFSGYAYNSGSSNARKQLWKQDFVGQSGFGLSNSSWRLSYSLDSGTTYNPFIKMTNLGAMSLFKDSATLSFGSINGFTISNLSNQQFYISTAVPLSNSGAFNTAVGVTVLPNISTGTRNTGFGHSALQTDTSGSFNTAVGYVALNGLTSGYSNTGIGMNAMLVATSGFQNTSIGAGSMEALTIGQENTGVGYDAGLNATTAIRNVWLGWNAKSGTDGYQNEMIGYTAGASLTAGNHDNIGIGFQSMFNASQKVDATNSIALGLNSFTTANNQVVIGNSSMTQNIFWGALMPNSSAGTTGQVLISQGANTSPVWSSTPTATIPISSLTAATATNTIDNATRAQVWNWTGLAGATALELGATSTAAASNSHLMLSIYTNGANSNSTQTTTAASFASSHSGTASTNIALRLNAGSGTNNYALITDNGLVGIGVPTPTSNLEVFTNQTTGAGAKFTAASTTSGTILDITGTSTALAANNEGLNIGISGANGTNAITATGARISVTNTNGTSGTNVGLDITASGATTANNALNIAAGAITLNGSAGTNGQVLMSAGASSVPTWGSVAGGATRSDTLYVLASGQSNGPSGFNDGNYDTAPNDSVFAYNGTSFVMMQRGVAPMGWCTPGTLNSSGCGGAAITDSATGSVFYFAKRLQERTNKVIRVISVPYAGNAIESWIPAASTNFTTITNYMAAIGNPQIDYFIWDQGESNATTTDTGYVRKVDTLVQQLDAKPFFSKSVPIFIITTRDSVIFSTILNIQYLLGSGQLDKRYVTVDAANELYYTPSPIHFSAQGQYNIANKMIQLAFNRLSIPNAFMKRTPSQRANMVTQLKNYYKYIITQDSTLGYTYIVDQPVIATTNDSLTIKQTGGSYGESGINIINESSVFGAQFYNNAFDLTGISMKTSTAATKNILFEHRGGQVMSGNTNGEIQLQDGSGVTTAFGVAHSGIASDLVIGSATVAATAKLEVIGSTKTYHIIGGTSAPTIAAGTGAGTSPTVTVGSGSTDLGGYVNITTGSVPAGTNATVATITFNVAYGSAPSSIILYPANALTATLSGVAMVFVDQAAISTTTFTIVSGTTALTGASAYKFFYQVIQ